MSRIGKLPISIPANVTVAVSNDNVITVKGPKGELSQKIDSSIAVVVEEGTIVVKYSNCETYAEATKQQHAFHGLYRALINNMVIGVSEGFRKELELVGNNLRSVVLLTIALPLTATQATLDIELRTLTNIFINDLSEVTPQGHGVPLGVLGGLVCLTIEDTLRRSEAYTGNLNASLEATHLGVLTHVTY